ncbi:prephenate dehydrogenase [Secundilactobacillus malefermentans]|uniref:Prephenate/arogenate dehydrogenase domain-containing protein n=1 Tax=Secundilactobacillus malefermentans TaxID=176292 RepID=A0A4R5NRD7_9LACO|nr:prephenate dehydrogenase/arogenate dehydrogenase family protein [Secundilactobacillus malefermentans]KRM58781.1 prephenate dehydrogenase [Secundilactobacillus malefermentans DSM 5705 = KCTC 3548]QEA31618.1 prephenate dehydrogenase/arogenate dehydrogenase family protein [Secundilactobacillus malefermentans]TDG78959.1 hypothetical protein C5L31_000554 [Secundilactobacillus malefermentans]
MTQLMIVGLGEMGGSLAASLKAKKVAVDITGVDQNQQSLTVGLSKGWIDQAGTLADASEMDFIVLATPVTIIRQTLAQLAKQPLKSTVVVTDLGSTKGQITQIGDQLGARFIGGHPMIGSQKAGIEAADAKLLVGCQYFLTPTTPTVAMVKWQTLLTPLQISWHIMSPANHDQMMATLSDLPHVVAATLAVTASETFQDDASKFKLAAGGFKDTTRIGAADPTMWRDILLSNQESTLAEIDHFQTKLAKLREAIAANDGQAIMDYFKQGQAVHNKLKE